MEYIEIVHAGKIKLHVHVIHIDCVLFVCVLENLMRSDPLMQLAQGVKVMKNNHRTKVPVSL